MTIIGNPRHYHPKWKFRVEIDGVEYAGFQTCSELSAEAGQTEIWEGGASIPSKGPARMTFSDITLERGATVDGDLYTWFRQVFAAAAGIGQPDPVMKRNLDIVQLDRNDAELQRWRVFGAWPKKFVAGDWDNTSDEYVIESVTLAIDFFELG